MKDPAITIFKATRSIQKIVENSWKISKIENWRLGDEKRDTPQSF